MADLVDLKANGFASGYDDVYVGRCECYCQSSPGRCHSIGERQSVQDCVSACELIGKQACFCFPLVVKI